MPRVDSQAPSPLLASLDLSPLKLKLSSSALQLDSREPAEGLFICATM